MVTSRHRKKRNASEAGHSSPWNRVVLGSLIVLECSTVLCKNFVALITTPGGDSRFGGYGPSPVLFIFIALFAGIVCAVSAAREIINDAPSKVNYLNDDPDRRTVAVVRDDETDRGAENLRSEPADLEQHCLSELSNAEARGDRDAVAAYRSKLGAFYHDRRDLDRAEEMYRATLILEEERGHREGLAAAYGNLGAVCESRGENGRARELWMRSLMILRDLGADTMAEQVAGWIASLPRESR